MTTSTKVKPYTLKELAVAYGVSFRTIKNWLKPHELKIGERIGHTYTILQVQRIFELLGEPQEVECGC